MAESVRESVDAPLLDRAELTLDPNGPVAIHEQLSRALRDWIGRMKAASRLPTEQELVDRFGVSRTTVRRAVQTLVDDGLLVRRQGKGTFVGIKRPVQMIDRLAPFVESFTSSGIELVARLLQYSWLSDPSEAPAALKLSGDNVLWIRRAYTSEGLPLAVAEIYVSEKFGRTISRADIEEHPIYQVLQERAHRQPHRAEIGLIFTNTKPDIAAVLDLGADAIVPRLQRVTCDEQGEILECTVAYFRPEAFELRTAVTVDQPRPISFSFSKK